MDVLLAMVWVVVIVVLLVLVVRKAISNTIRRGRERNNHQGQEAAAKESVLQARLSDVRFQSGEQFEYYMADVFKSLSCRVQVLGGTGDQGVDLLVRDGDALIAVQCKRHRNRVGNSAVQQVYAGARHYGANQAWVVSPAGFTDSAYELARSTDVRLYDFRSIEQWVEAAEQQKEKQRVQSVEQQNGTTHQGTHKYNEPVEEEAVEKDEVKTMRPLREWGTGSDHLRGWGTGSDYLRVNKLHSGVRTFTYTYQDEGPDKSYFFMELLDSSERSVELIVKDIGSSQAAKVIRVARDDVYYVNVQAGPGSWTLDIT